ncbi:hypothetical protein N7486_002682 [Penicillium sp. IBT 16267x]|nr:hypothetical protein N7486_002682 [Penicillium sp. IBT 16267x]
MPTPCTVPFDDESDASSVLPEVFSNNASDSDSSIAASDLDASSSSESELESDDESEDELALDDEEEQLSPEHYLREAESLDVSKLRQKRYSPKTTIGIGINRDLVECLSWLSNTEETVRFLKALFS